MKMSSFSVVWASHPRWPLPPTPTSASTSATTAHDSQSSPSSNELHVSLLDSSFNPPTLAHLALASHPAPRSRPAYTARCLALSIKNADKAAVDDDSVRLRLAMMRCLGEEMERVSAVEGGTAVVVYEEPIFFRKSSIVKEELERRIAQLGGNSTAEKGAHVRLSFVVGWDTITRIFDKKYYASPSAMSSALSQFFAPPGEGGEGSAFSCARRGDVPAAEEVAFLERDEVAQWVKAGGIEMFELGDEVKGASSTEVRRRVAQGERLDGVVVPSVAEVIKREGMYKQ